MDKHLKALEFDKILVKLSEYCCCDEAREAAMSLLPTSFLSEAQAYMNQTSDAHMLLGRFGGPSFGGLKNVNNSLRRADAGGVLTMKELLDIAETLRIIRGLSQWRGSNSGVESCLDALFGALMPNKFLEEAITSAIISEEEMSDNASPELAQIRKKIRIQQSKVRDQLDKMIHSQHYRDILQDTIVTMRNGRYVIPVKAEHRAQVPGLVHDTSSSGATVFIEPAAVVETNNTIKVLLAQERDEMERILASLSAQAGSFADSIKNSFDCAVEINVIFAKAKLAYSMNAAVPSLNDKGIIDFHSARHPLLNKDKAVPVDIRLGREFDTLVITGPNTGGKTVSIKTLGLLSAMAACGLMLPVNELSEVSVFGQILADIGDEQSIEQSLSTFSAHMTNIIDILSKADSASLVLIDELGAGTDPVEGAALATAILEFLRQKGAKVAATTHYAELKAYALSAQGVENGCCEFDVATLRPTYRLLIGMPGRSNAFAISERLGMDKKIVERASELVSTENSQFEKVIASLETDRKALEDEKERAFEETMKAKKLREDAQEKKEKLDKDREKELEAAKLQAQKIIDNARREAYSLLAELDKLRKERDKTKDISDLARRARSTINKGVASMEDATMVEEADDDEDYVLPGPLKEGDTVLIRSVGMKGTVASLPDKAGDLVVMAGAARMRVNTSDLKYISSAPKKETPSPVSGSAVDKRAERKFSARLDLRGKTVDEALIELDRYIDQCLVMKMGEFTIVHGKGTGALRAAVHDFLRTNKYVKSFRLGAFGEGDTGVTIVTMK